MAEVQERAGRLQWLQGASYDDVMTALVEDGSLLVSIQSELAALREQRDELLKAVMLAVVNIDCERNGLTPDGNVRERLVAVINK